MEHYQMRCSAQIMKKRGEKPAYPTGKYQYFRAFPKETRETSTLITRSHEEAASWMDLGHQVYWIDSSCSFCGGPTPCLKDD